MIAHADKAGPSRHRACLLVFLAAILCAAMDCSCVAGASQSTVTLSVEGGSPWSPADAQLMYIAEDRIYSIDLANRKVCGYIKLRMKYGTYAFAQAAIQHAGLVYISPMRFPDVEQKKEVLVVDPSTCSEVARIPIQYLNVEGFAYLPAQDRLLLYGDGEYALDSPVSGMNVGLSLIDPNTHSFNRSVYCKGFPLHIEELADGRIACIPDNNGSSSDDSLMWLDLQGNSLSNSKITTISSYNPGSDDRLFPYAFIDDNTQVLGADFYQFTIKRCDVATGALLQELSIPYNTGNGNRAPTTIAYDPVNDVIAVGSISTNGDAVHILESDGSGGWQWRSGVSITAEVGGFIVQDGMLYEMADMPMEEVPRAIQVYSLPNLTLVGEITFPN